MLVVVPLKNRRAHVISTDGPRALTRYLARLGITRPRATLDQVNAVSWAVVLRGDDTFRVLADVERGRVESVSMRNAVALMFGAAATHARKKSAPVVRRGRDASPSAVATGPRPLFQLPLHKILDARAPARAEQAK